MQINFKIKLIITAGINIVFFISSCEKKPNASFTTDKEVYSAGETVKLTNTSKSGSTFVWIMPDGHNQTTKDASFITECNMGFGTLSFGLTDKSKGHCARSFNSKRVKIIPQTWLKSYNIPNNTNKTYIPYQVSIINNSNAYTFSAQYILLNSNGATSSYYNFGISFKAGSQPQAGIYSLQSSNIGLQSNTAFIAQVGGPPDSQSTIIYSNGQINVEYINNTLHIYFTDADTNPIYLKLSADMYVPL